MSNKVHDSDLMTPERRLRFGQGFFVAGIILLVLRGLTLTTRMPGLPASWYNNQSIWIAIGLAMVAFGWNLLWRTPQTTETSWKPSIQGRRFRIATLYVGDGCHLCEETVAVLASYQKWLPVIEEVNIRSDPMLIEKYCTCVPVLSLDNKVRFRGKINALLLQRLIEGTPPTENGESS